MEYFAELTDSEQKKVIDRLLNTDICIFYEGEEEIKDGCRISEFKCPWGRPEHYKSCGRWTTYQSKIKKRSFQKFRLIRIENVEL